MPAVSSYGNDAVTTVSGAWQFLAIKSPMGPTRIKLARRGRSATVQQASNKTAGFSKLTKSGAPQPSSSHLFPPSFALGIMKSLAVGLTWLRIKFTSFQGCQSSVEFLPLIFPPPRLGAGKERADRQEGEKARKMSILPVVGGARTQFASNYEETDTSNRLLISSCLLPGRHSLTPDGAAPPSSRATPRVVETNAFSRDSNP
ncbi:hypothetical protein ALC60_03167 [Trachymyrmex zeteki]|uniref:Uncharacterized protein n=1 Tax=Mycetomoellerius zeteki TaxID=64791 RepID=A0A151XBX6_9HYME|nr:hypothetical protein ALC60_03167 [Trachymyrmex zeteki]